KFVVLPEHRTTIRNALKKLADADADQRSMTHFIRQVADEKMRESLKPYSLDGNNAMLDGESDNITLDRFVVFEMEHLMGMGDRFAIP
ncbi:hypothetical protein, partial [Chryseobacterium sp. SIMBA_038]